MKTVLIAAILVVVILIGFEQYRHHAQQDRKQRLAEFEKSKDPKKIGLLPDGRLCVIGDQEKIDAKLADAGCQPASPEALRARGIR